MIFFNLLNNALSFVKLLILVAQDYYPDMLGNIYLVNTNFFFKAMWSLFSYFIDEKTLSKIVVTRNDYKDSLLGLVDQENLPTILDGSYK